LTGFDYEDRVVPAMSSSSQPPPPSEAGETDTDAEHPASLREQSSRSTHRAYDRARSDSIAAGLVQQNLPKGDISHCNANADLGASDQLKEVTEVQFGR
jgi:hypothetical protein